MPQSPVKTELSRALRPTRCFYKEKHSFQIDRRIHGGVVMKCKWTLCQKSVVLPSVLVKALFSR